MRLRLHRHGPQFPPLSLQGGLLKFAPLQFDRRVTGWNPAQVRQIFGRAQSQRLAQVQGEQDALARIFADTPLRATLAAHPAIVGAPHSRSVGSLRASVGRDAGR